MIVNVYSLLLFNLFCDVLRLKKKNFFLNDDVKVTVNLVIADETILSLTVFIIRIFTFLSCVFRPLLLDFKK